LTYASMTLEGLEQEKENAEMLVPIGGSSYVKAKLTESDKVVVGIGAGVSAEKTVAEAKAVFKERLEELQKTMGSAQQQFAQVADRINSGRNRLESLLTSVREGKAQSDV
jgi:prefoldin alpha subunit